MHLPPVARDRVRLEHAASVAQQYVYAREISHDSLGKGPYGRSIGQVDGHKMSCEGRGSAAMQAARDGSLSTRLRAARKDDRRTPMEELRRDLLANTSRCACDNDNASHKGRYWPKRRIRHVHKYTARDADQTNGHGAQAPDPGEAKVFSRKDKDSHCAKQMDKTDPGGTATDERHPGRQPNLGCGHAAHGFAISLTVALLT
eukprot:scaffold3580_cov115-Isochrysis_galbana.AAC.1